MHLCSYFIYASVLWIIQYCIIFRLFFHEVYMECTQTHWCVKNTQTTMYFARIWFDIWELNLSYVLPKWSLIWLPFFSSRQNVIVTSYEFDFLRIQSCNLDEQFLGNLFLSFHVVCAPQYFQHPFELSSIVINKISNQRIR